MLRSGTFISGHTTTPSARKHHSRLMIALASAGLMLASTAHAADFVNGGFEDATAFNGWTRHGYEVPDAIPTFPPVKASDLGLILDESNDRSAVLGSGNDSTTGGATGLVWTDRVARVHTSNSSSGKSNKASSIEQQITVSATDRDAGGKVHIRFVAAPVLEAPDHGDDEQPYFFIEITKSDGTVLFSTFNFANQPGIPWKSRSDVTYTDWQAFDIALDSTQVADGEKVTLKVIAAGCGRGAHTGSVYVNNVRTTTAVNSASLWVTAEGPVKEKRHSNPDGTTDVIYTYTYKNDGATPVNNVTVMPGMPQTTDATPKTTSFVSIGTPTFGGGSCTAPATSSAPASCNIGTLAPGDTGTFTMTVRVPADTEANQLNNGNYPIQGTNVPVLLGPLVKTALEADMIPDLTNLPATATPGLPYTGSFACVNQGATAALSSSCSVSDLPAGVKVVAGSCKLALPAPSTAVASWAKGDTVPAAATVTCDVSGTVSPAAVPTTVVVETDATNNDDKTNNRGTKAVTVTAPDMAVNLSGLPTTAMVTKAYSGSFACTNVGGVDATAGTSCSVSDLPPGVTVGACTLSPANSAWAAGNTVPVGETVTCQVGGTVTGLSSGPVVGQTNVTGDADPKNNTAQLAISVTPAAPDMGINLGGLPKTGTVGKPYTGSFTCSNTGNADATANTSCVATGLPAGVTQDACTLTPGGTAWTAGNAVPVGGTVTCQVNGTVTAVPTAPVIGQTNATGDGNPANNTAQLTLAITPAAPKLVVDLGGLPRTGTVGKPYKGSFTCSNIGNADATATTSCVATDLPPGVTQGACTVTPGDAAWAQGDVIAEGAVVTCEVSGTPTKVGETTATGTSGTATDTAVVKVAEAPQAQPVPTLSQWGQILMAGLLAAMGVFTMRRRNR